MGIMKKRQKNDTPAESRYQQFAEVEKLKQVNKRQAGTFSRRKWVEHSKKPGRKIWKYVQKLRYRFWSLTFRLGLFLIGVNYFNSAIFDGRGSDWGMERILTLAAGISLPIISILLSVPKIINRSERFGKLELFSRYLVQASVGCFVSLLLIELTLRVVIQSPSLHKAVTNWAGDIPAVHAVVLWGKEGYAITQYEKWGEIRTPFHDSNRNNDVIVLGDSQTECLQVDDNLKFVSVAETTLRKDGYNADLHNLGRSGLAMADYISWIPPYRSLYRPKVIVIQLTGDDFFESFHKDQFNYFVTRDDNKIDLVQTYDLSSGFTQTARRGIYFVPQIETLGYQRWSVTWGASGSVSSDNVVSEATGNAPRENVSPEVFTPVLAEQQMKMLIEASDGIPLVVVLLPTAPYISGNEVQMADPAHAQLKEFMEGYPEITVVDPLPEFQKLVSTGHLPRGFFNSTPGMGHLNKYGNEIVGNLLAAAIGQVLK
jgi:hypothetical protein